MQVEVKSVDMIKSSIHSTLSQISKLGQFSVIIYLVMEHNCIWSNMTAISALPSEDCHCVKRVRSQRAKIANCFRIPWPEQFSKWRGPGVAMSPAFSNSFDPQSALVQLLCAINHVSINATSNHFAFFLFALTVNGW